MKYIKSRKQFNSLRIEGIHYDEEIYFFYNYCYDLYKNLNNTKYIPLRPSITVTKFSSTPEIGCYKKFREHIMKIKPSKNEYKVIGGGIPFDKTSDIKVPYIYDIKEKGRAMLAGTSFDYLARIILCKYSNCKFKLNETKGYDWLQHSIDSFSIINKELLIKTKILMDELELNIESYMESDNDIFSDSMLEGICILSRLENAYRSGISDLEGYEKTLLMKYDNVIYDLKNLGKNFIENFIQVLNINKNSKIILNPNFGSKSSGFKADGDVIIDGCLIDFKVSKNYKYEGKDACQITTYYMLNEFNKTNNNITVFDFSSVALYNVRYGKILKFDIANKVSLEKRKEIIKSLIF